MQAQSFLAIVFEHGVSRAVRENAALQKETHAKDADNNLLTPAEGAREPRGAFLMVMHRHPHAPPSSNYTTVGRSFTAIGCT
jgi:hypothetical protein